MPAPLWVFLSYEVESNSCFLIKKTPWVLEIIFVGKKEDFILLRQPFKFQNTVFRHFFIQFLSSDTVLCPQHWRGVTGTQGAGLVLALGHRELKWCNLSSEQRNTLKAEGICGEMKDVCKGAVAHP